MHSNKNSLFIKILVTFLILLLLSSPALSASEPSLKSRQKSVEKQLEEAKSKKAEAAKEEADLKTQLDEADKNLVSTQKELDGLEQELAETQESKKQIIRELEQIESNLEGLRRKLERAKKELRRLRKIFNSRVNSIYRQGSITYIETFFAIRNFSDFINHLYFFGRIVHQDAELLKEIKLQEAQIKNNKKEVEAKKDQVKSKKEALVTQERKQTSLVGSQKSRKQEIKETIEGKNDLLAQVSKDKAAFEAAEEELEESSREIALLIQNTQSSSGKNQNSAPEKQSAKPISQGKGFIWPTSGTVTSGFGWRTHPIFKIKKLHTGIDIAAPTGQSIVAAQSGEIIFAGWKGGYGLTLVINHGNGLSTLYAHTSSLLAQTGESVDRGEVVAKVGATGNTTGPHLHFEVRINGNPVNPMNYF